MGFNIFASGVTGLKEEGGRGHFHYSKDNCLDQGDFSPPVLLSLIPSSTNAAGVAKKAVGTPDSHLGSATVTGMSKIAGMQYAEWVRTGVDMLAMHGSGGEISVHCAQKKSYWADAAGRLTFYLSHSSDPGRDFLKAVGPILVETELNNFGVLAQIAIVLDKYDQQLPKSSSSSLNIMIDH